MLEALATSSSSNCFINAVTLSPAISPQAGPSFPIATNARYAVITEKKSTPYC